MLSPLSQQNFVVLTMSVTKEDAVDTVSKPPPKVFRGGRSGRGGRGARNRRQDEYTVKVNEVFFKGPNATRGRVGMEKKWEVHDLPKIKIDNPVVSKVPEWLSVSTRGVGAIVACCYNRLLSEQPAKVPNICSIFQAYRACLAQMSVRLARQQDGAPCTNAVKPVDFHDAHIDVALQDKISSYSQTSAPLLSLSTGIGWFEHQQKFYQTYVGDGFPDGHLSFSSAFVFQSLFYTIFQLAC